MDNKNTIYSFLLSQYNKNPIGVCALMGNLYAESGLNPKNLQNSYEVTLGFTDETYTQAVDNQTYSHFIRDCAGYGLAQWTYWSRKQGLYNYCKSKNKSIGDLTAQLEYLVKEIASYKAVASAISSAKTIREASDIILTQFERPADQSEKAKAKRAEYGESFYKELYSAPKTTQQTNNTAPTTTYKVKVTIDDLNIRKGPGTNYRKLGKYTGAGVFTIVETQSGKGSTNGWGLLKSYAANRDGWISLDYVTKI